MTITPYEKQAPTYKHLGLINGNDQVNMIAQTTINQFKYIPVIVCNLSFWDISCNLFIISRKLSIWLTLLGGGGGGGIMYNLTKWIIGLSNYKWCVT